MIFEHLCDSWKESILGQKCSIILGKSPSCYIVFQVLKKVVELLPSELTIKQVTIDLENALWGAFRTILPAVFI